MAQDEPDFEMRISIPFADTDMAGIVHFSNFFRYMENTEHEFYRSLGFSVHPDAASSDGPHIGWPRVQASCDYRLPLRFEDTVTVELRVSEIRRRSVCYEFTFIREGASDAVARGTITVVCVELDPERRSIRKAIPIPEFWKAKLESPGLAK